MAEGSSLHAEAARAFFELMETPGYMMDKVRRLAPIISELDERYGPGWEDRPPFRDAYDRLLEQHGIEVR